MSLIGLPMRIARKIMGKVGGGVLKVLGKGVATLLSKVLGSFGKKGSTRARRRKTIRKFFSSIGDFFSLKSAQKKAAEIAKRGDYKLLQSL
jgi:hypothetical protein